MQRETEDQIRTAYVRWFQRHVDALAAELGRRPAPTSAASANQLVRRVSDEVDRLAATLGDYALIERGVHGLMGRHGCDAATAFEALAGSSHGFNTTLGVVAGQASPA